ncbi:MULTISPECIES: hypothetical protein [unclassified Acidovorax]|jgi:hypothetical protein|uniref:hypothetical protein n=1 Tax=unclassified Acidovorax TaxID=2684926 RepID=UPI000B163DDB|nr:MULTISPECIES: hypothetical protein [unclassified Acidovorax]
MKIRAVGVLAFINLVLLCGLALMWVKPDGTPRNIRWNEPAPLKADIAGLAPALMPDKQMESSRFLAMLERPLFSATRRPPPPPPPEQPPPPPDYLSTARVTGIVRGEGVGYAILLVNGKQRRVQQNQSVEGWTLKSFGDRQVTFVRGEQSQTLTMQRADVSKYGGFAQPAPTVQAAQPMPTPSSIERRGDGSIGSAGAAVGASAGTAEAPARPRPPPPRFGP